MKSCSTNEIKVYNLSAGKALPEWLAEKKKRSMKLKKLTGRHHIELIQDFDMPGLSTNVQITPDGNYILATGIYKPRVRCYDVKNLSMKFERCFDSEVMKFLVLSDDYSKLAFLHADRFVEFHAQYGRYFRLRIPKFGRDLTYYAPTCDLYIGGVSSEVYRLNLELGRFNTPLSTSATCVNVCKTNPLHHLICLGTEDGTVEAWDPRSARSCGILDITLSSSQFDATSNGFGIPRVTSMAFRDGLKYGVGTSSGCVLLYDLRSSKPLLVKNHYNSQPITDLEFHKQENVVFSMDRKVVKVWHEDDGEPYTAVEAGDTEYNDLCVVPGTGMFFTANEDRKIFIYYAPSLGPAPKWCAFLDNITEELEETETTTVYDDYKFVTERELHDLGLEHLIGTNLLRGYMHGYFLDIRLYRKAKQVVQPFQFQEYKRKKIADKLLATREDRLRLNKLPSINKELAMKIISTPVSSQKSGNLMEDSRFQDLFKNPDFQIDKMADEYRLINPVLSKNTARAKKFETAFTPVEELDGKPSSEESSSDDEYQRANEMRQQKAKMRKEGRQRRTEEDAAAEMAPKFYELRQGEAISNFTLNRGSGHRKTAKLSLEERVSSSGSDNVKSHGPLGGREMSFKFRSRKDDAVTRLQEQQTSHRRERKMVRRSAGTLKNKKASWKK